MTHVVLLRCCLAFLWIAILLAPAPARAQAQPAPIPPSPNAPIYTPDATSPDNDESPLYGSATAPDWSSQNGSWLPACAGIACLSPAQRQEITALCGKAGADWAQFTVCREMNERISQGLGP